MLVFRLASLERGRDPSPDSKTHRYRLQTVLGTAFQVRASKGRRKKISEVAQSKKRQHESDEENQPLAPVKRPRPRPITRMQQSVDPTAQKTSSRPASRTSTTKSKAPELSEGESDGGALLPKPKPKPKPRARASAKASKDAAAHGGRKKGTSNYSIEEDRALLTVIEKFLPIGGKMWETVANEYERWCAARQHPIRDHKSIRARYSVILKHAQSKPTGDPKRGEDDPYHIVLRVEDMITAKSGQLTIDDSEFEDDTNLRNGDVINISSDEGPPPPPAKFVAAKAYKASTAPPPDTKPRRGSNLVAATNTLTAIGAVFNPEAMQARDDQRMSNSVHLTQIASLQVENRELRVRMDLLQDRLQTETRRADKAETQVEMYIQMIEAPLHLAGVILIHAAPGIMPKSYIPYLNPRPLNHANLTLLIGELCMLTKLVYVHLSPHHLQSRLKTCRRRRQTSRCHRLALACHLALHPPSASP
ncbi:hypothetical protein EYR40_003304 [Pleurotus pulmonarius]|nr:hypothetical protein EYR40_003304 [Pleurotus pulmonarius]KAF4606032.1 hypothetical protein EYR38_000077 [Pleurotus pulmonarius]